MFEIFFHINYKYLFEILMMMLLLLLFWREFNWLPNTFATSDATVKSDGGNCGFDNDDDDDDSFELSV